MKSSIKTKYKNSKLLMFALVFVVLFGVFMPRAEVKADVSGYFSNLFQQAYSVATYKGGTLGYQPLGTCSGTPGAPAGGSPGVTSANCTSNGGTWVQTDSQAYVTCRNSGGTDTSCQNQNFSNSVNGQQTTITVPCVGKDASGNPTPAGCGTPQTYMPSTIIADPNANALAFQSYIAQQQCSVLPGGNGTFYPGCFIQLAYGLFYVIPAFLLWVTAYLFNFLLSITLTSALFSQASFVATAWGTVRDISNIFFILVLLYLAARTILGLAGHEVKKTIMLVIITALLINFSMFFTEIVIDSSNILALVFYNKLQPTQTINNGVVTTRQYTPAAGEKDVAGGLAAVFDPTRALTANFFNNQSTVVNIPAAGIQTSTSTAGGASPGIIIGVTILTGMIMLFAAYAFFIAGLSFVGRLIELWILIIFSPFALMSASTPLLENVDYLGWKHWRERLLTVAFMAPIFMFFMYFIFLLVGSNIFSPPTQTVSMIQTLLSILIPALILIIVLMKATEFAKKGSGALGNLVIKGTEIAMGLAAAAATGGVAVAGQTLVGKRADKWAESAGMKQWASQSMVGNFVQKRLRGLGSSSFDAREGIVGAGLAAVGGVSGLNLGHGSKFFRNAGGYRAQREKAEKERRQRNEELKVSEDEPLKQKLNKTEEDLQDLLNTNAREIETVDKLIEKKRQEAADAERKYAAGAISKADLVTATEDLDDAKKRKTALRTGTVFTDSTGTVYDYDVTAKTSAGGTIDSLDKQKSIDAQAIKEENRVRAFEFAQSTRGGWARNLPFIRNMSLVQSGYDQQARNAAAHKIIMDSKIEDKK